MPATPKIEDIANNLRKAAKSPDGKKLAGALLDYIEAKKTDPDAPLYQFGITPTKELAEILSELKNCPEWEEAVCEKAGTYLQIAKKETLKHKILKKHIEDAIGLLIENCDVSEKGEGYRPFALLAKAYLMRSNIIRPKGITIPERKKEAIDKGIKYADVATNLAKEKKEIKDAWRIKALLYLELQRIQRGTCKADEKESYTDKITDALYSAVDKGCNDINNFVEDLKIIVHYSRANSNDAYLKNIDLHSLSHEKIELEKAMAYKILKDTDNLYEEMQKLTVRLENIYLTSPVWDDTVNFINELRVDNIEGWKDLAILTWEACGKVLNKTMSNLHIRWYWSRQRLLYDLAFMAADKFSDKGEKYHKKADIADSLKSRPALRWNALNESAKNYEILKKSLEAEADSGYLKNIKVTYAKTKPRVFNFNKDSVPEGWIVIHFYINQLEKKGYALIYDNTDPGKEESKKWKEEPFEYNELFNSYIEWQGNYNRLPHGEKHKSAESLVALCKEIGKALPFLFKLPNNEQENTSVLFIPHDFLHRLPLHAAINGENNVVFLINHPNCYLPAWSFYRDKIDKNVENMLLFKNVENAVDLRELKGISKLNCWEINTNEVSTKEFVTTLEKLPKPPKVLSIFCHGKANAVNPFNAKLKLRVHEKITLQSLVLNSQQLID
ncbi:MAG TPA: hypothetical protein ENG83_12990 [Nitrospirae bacterium]|nr:hypothetical protein BMS3Abin06_00704 [bacterium BMS3Abin06]HDH13093.1 hypothetical protein [Nitrospirota bacterium]HDZ02107.1 hypothetical protein [Nitrospirota bacterium]